MYKKILCMLLIFISLITLNSCKIGGQYILIIDEPSIADARMEQIVSAIKNNDKKSLIYLFSKKALVEDKSIEDEADYLFDFIQGDIISWERFTWSSDDDYRKEGKNKKIRSWYTVTTDKETYMFLIVDFSTDTIDPDNAGLYTLRVIKAEDKETQFPSWQEIEIAGIYKPE